jgi:hypothetical protein
MATGLFFAFMAIAFRLSTRAHIPWNLARTVNDTVCMASTLIATPRQLYQIVVHCSVVPTIFLGHGDQVDTLRSVAASSAAVDHNVEPHVDHAAKGVVAADWLHLFHLRYLARLEQHARLAILSEQRICVS